MTESKDVSSAVKLDGLGSIKELQPETLADGNWLVKQNQPVSRIETKSDKLEHYLLGEANTDTLLYKLWQKLHDTPVRAAQPDSHIQQPNAKPLAQLSSKWSMPNVTFKNQKQVPKNRTGTIHTTHKKV